MLGDQRLDPLHRQIQVIGVERAEPLIEEEGVQASAGAAHHLGQAQGQAERGEEGLTARQAVRLADHVGGREVDDLERPILGEPVPARGEPLEVLRTELGQRRPLLVQQKADELGIGQVGGKSPEGPRLVLQPGAGLDQIARCRHQLLVALDLILEEFHLLRDRGDRHLDVALEIEPLAELGESSTICHQVGSIGLHRRLQRLGDRAPRIPQPLQRTAKRSGVVLGEIGVAIELGGQGDHSGSQVAQGPVGLLFGGDGFVE